ncbi:hypothetical protein ECBP5_0032 [Escherichia phage ECBP5]|uniref:Uncharacterized protein n=1 Tax=Escherichia phage ECBP5 TaxID=1498172 RepID=A0A0F6N5L3_9CAUD|nr:hypothetical protein ECBP5_0032 [Escherichia phage ECBP5]AID17686.1 hypothetical protein ECBP5_0032 [Escherichia phage ECBP5]
MTKLPEIISRRFNVITGKEVPLGCMDEDYPRASGRTTGIALRAISDTILTGVPVFVTDHDDYPSCYTEHSAKLLAGRIRALAEQMNLNGIEVEAVSTPQRRLNGSYVWGAQVSFHLHQEVTYDLRK